MKNPNEFKTPAFNTGYNPYLWPSSFFNGEQSEMDRFTPFNGFGISFYGKNWNVSLSWYSNSLKTSAN